MNNLDGKTWLQYSFSIWRDIRKTKEENSLKHPAMFPSQLTSRLIEIFTKTPGEVVLDPFMGAGSTLVSAKNLEKKGVGFEISTEYIKTAQERLKSIQTNLKGDTKKIYPEEIYAVDSRKLCDYVPKNSVDLAITSPPYWDILNQKRTADYKEIRNYGNSISDLGNIDQYETFLNELQKVSKNVYDVLKPGKRFVVVVMDIRKKSKFYPFHMDLTKKMQEIGFELEDIIIWDRQHEYNNMKTLGYPWVFRFNKVHEFICIFLKKALKNNL